jgi:hypothetical protein
MDKSLKLQMKIDTSDFDRMATELQSKLSRIYSPAQNMQAMNQTGARLGAAGLGNNGPGQQAFERASQNHQRDLNTLIKDEAQKQQDSAKFLAQRAQTLQRLVDLQKQMTAGSAEELRIRETIGRVEANNAKLNDSFQKQNGDLNGLLDQRQKTLSPMQQIREGYRNGGVRGAAGAANDAMGGGGALAAAVGSVISVVTQVARAGSDVYKYLGNAPISSSSAYGSAANTTLGREVNAAYSGRQGYEMAFMSEKAKAAGMSMEQTRRVRNTQFLDAGLDMAGGAFSSGLKGAAVGGLIAGPLGAIAGGVGGAAYGAVGGFNANKSTLLSPFSEKASVDREAQLAKNFAAKFSEALEGEQNANPFKKAAADYYQNTYSQSLDAQRGMGLNYDSFHGVGGFKDQVTGAGFSNDLGMGMQSSILSAGGSSRSAYGNSVLGLQMQRGMNLTNAGSILGNLSSGQGDSKSTEAATIKILAQGMKLGLDDSKFAEENRRFTQAAAEIVTRSGATGNDVGRVSGNFSDFVAEKTNKGIDAAKGAYDQYQSMSKETSGARGVMRSAGILSDPDLAKLSTFDKQALLQVPEEDLNAENSVVKNAANGAGVSADEIVKKMKGINRKSVSRTNSFDDKADYVRRRLKETGRSKYDPSDKTMPSDITQAYDSAASTFSVENGYPGQRQLNASMVGLTAVDGFGAADSKSVTDKLGNLNTGKVEDTTVQGTAESSKLVNDNFREFKDTLIPAAEQIAKFNANLKQTVEILSKLPEADRAKAFGQINSGLYGTPATPSNQSQAGKKSN